MRYALILVCLLAALAGSVVAIGASLTERDMMLRGYVDATRNQDIPYRVPLLGVNAELTQYTPDELSQQLRRMQEANITWVRQVFRWDEIEPFQGQYTWDKWDTLVNAIAAYPDLKLTAVLMNTPSWASSSDHPTAPPLDMADFADFASQLAARYASIIDYYQIWDEPNITLGWGNTHPQAAQYRLLLQSGYEAVHAADSGAYVIAAALAPTTEQGPANISDVRFLDDLYALGAAPYLDAVGAKPYGFNLSPLDRTVHETVLNFSRVILLREVMVKHGDGQKPVWASNWGWNHLPDHWGGEQSIWGDVSQDERIEYTLRALTRAAREWPWMAGMFLQHWQPDAESNSAQWGFALIDQQNQPSPLWEALTQQEPSQFAQNGLFFASNPFAQYSGVWTFSPLGADIGWVNDSQITFTFAGQDVALLVREDDYVAYLYPTIDGAQANALPQDTEGNAYLLLTSDTLRPQLNLVTIARGLPPGPHTLRIVADELVPDEIQDRWAIVGYAVSTGNLEDPYNRQIIIAMIAAGITLSATLLTLHAILQRVSASHLIRFWRWIGQTGQLIVGAGTSVLLLLGMLLTWGDVLPSLFRREPVVLISAILSAGLLYIQPGLLFVLVAAVMLFFIIFNRIEIGLCLVIFWCPFFLFPVELYQYAFPMAEILMLLTGAAWLARSLITLAKNTRSGSLVLPHITAMDTAILLWLLLSVFSMTQAEYRSPAFTDLRVMTLEPSLFYLVLRTSSMNRKTLLMLVDTLLLAGLVVAVVGFWLYLQGEVITAEGGVQRMVSVYGSPNNVSLFLGKTAPFALSFALLAGDPRRKRIAGSVFVVFVLAIIFTQSAGALFLGLPLSIAGTLILIYRKRLWWILLGLGALSLSAFVIALRSARFAQLLDFTSGTNFARLRVWQSAINIIRSHPLTGIGPDQFLYAFRGRYIMPDAWQEPDLSHPHNFILDLWVRLGVSGVLLFGWLQLLFWKYVWQAYTWSKDRDPLIYMLAIGTMGSMINLLGHGLVDNSIYVHDLAYVFMLLLGLSTHLSNTRAIDEASEMMV